MTVHVRVNGGVALVTIDRAERRNAVDLATLHELRSAQLGAVGSQVRCLVLTGAPPAFCAGADLTGAESGEFLEALGAVLRGFVELAIPTIAAVDGPALGAGTQLVVACDLRVATERSTFGIPAAKLGLAVDQWTAERLAREFGWSVARAMLIAAETYGTARLIDSGGIHRVGTLEHALAWAAEVAALAPLTMAAHKLALEASVTGNPARVEQARRAAWSSTDAEEGRAAFLDKRPPEFRGE